MPSAARSAAARANGARSHGPTTEEGKRRSADNGLTAGQRHVKRQVAQGFDQAALALVHEEHRRCFGPTDSFERNCVEAMALAEYSLALLEGLKGKLMTHSGTLHDLIRTTAGADGYDFLSRWMDREERALDRAHRRLLRHRASWRKGVVEPPGPAVDPDPAGDPGPANDDAPPPPAPVVAEAAPAVEEEEDDGADNLNKVLGEPKAIRLPSLARHLALLLAPGNPERGWSRRQLDLAAAAIEAANGRRRGIAMPAYDGAFDVDEVRHALATVTGTGRLTDDRLRALARLGR
jgi:hypothetical protein